MFLRTGDADLDLAFRMAVGDIRGNVAPHQAGLLTEPRPVLLAGLDYDTPWTRDAAFHAWNGASLLLPDTMRETLLSVLDRDGDRIVIGGQYWDAIIWAVGAWSHYLCTGDTRFLAIALEAVRHTLARREAEEFDEQIGLFRGPACYGDGVAAYPDHYAGPGAPSGILAWPAAHPEWKTGGGYGIPMHALSTNCLYYQAYVLADTMAATLDQDPDPGWAARAQRLRDAINGHFWDARSKHYRYLVDRLGDCDHQEGLGNALSVLFGIADDPQAVLEGQPTTPAGVPCVWPTFPRYGDPSGSAYGRHSGTVWPHIQALWADACAGQDRVGAAHRELRTLAAHACRDAQFAEIYHPTTGLSYGGLQERGADGIVEWPSCRRQTWSATGYLRMVLNTLFGLRMEPDRLTVSPSLPPDLDRIVLAGLRYRDGIWDIDVGRDTGTTEVLIDGQPVAEASIPERLGGEHTLVVPAGIDAGTAQ